MKRTLQTMALSGALAIGCSSVAQAEVVYHPITGFALGIQDMDIGGSPFDVIFEAGSYDTVYSASVPFFFGDEANASLLADQIVAIMDAEAPLAQIGPTDFQVVWVARSADATVFRAEQTGVNLTATGWRRYADFQGERTVEYTPSRTWLFATVNAPGSLVVPELPLPAGVVLLLTSLAGLGLARGRGASKG